MEEWKVIEEFPQYKVSNLGRVINIKKNKMYKHFDKDSKEELQEYLTEIEEPDYDTDYYSGYDIDSLDI